MPINRDAYLDNYLDELKENIEIMDSAIIRLKKTPENEEELAGLLRALHTIKGSSRVLNFVHSEEVAHGLENVFKGVKDKKLGITPPLVRLVFLATDWFRSAGDEIRKTGKNELPAFELLNAFEKASAGELFSLAELPESGKYESRGNGVSTGGKTVGTKTDTDSDTISPYETIRIKLSKTDHIMKVLNDLMMKQFRLKRNDEYLKELEAEFSDLVSARNRDGTEDSASGLSNRENDCLKRIRQLRKHFSLDMARLEKNMFDLQDEILDLRMLPLELILGSLPKMVEEIAMGLGKEIDFHLSGSDVKVDKIVLENLHDPIIHLVRNAAGHGIESPKHRIEKGKSAAGKLTISCSLESGHIVIKIADDGKGIDYEKIRTKAMMLHKGHEENIAAMNDEDLVSFIFSPGFSTEDKARELSGRGIGLDIVKYNIEKIKGKITVQSESGAGTEFVLSLPLSLATLEGFFIHSANEKFLVPANFVKEIIIAGQKDTLDLLDREAIKLRDKIVPIYYLNEMLGTGGRRGSRDRLFVMVVESFSELTGIVVDSVVQYGSLIYKPLPKSLKKLKFIQGIVFDESYDIINILYVPALLERIRGFRRIGFKTGDAYRSLNVLVVDDSYATREIERSILELENYTVVTANNGVEGLEKLKEHDIRLVITDINMPKMDGLDFVRNLRREKKYKRIPVIVVSADDDPGIKSKFLAQGADSFIIKADFDRGDLVSEVRSLIG